MGKFLSEKEQRKPSSKRIDKCPTLGQRFSDKFPTAGTDKMKRKPDKFPGGWALLELTEP